MRIKENLRQGIDLGRHLPDATYIQDGLGDRFILPLVGADFDFRWQLR